MPLGLFTAKKLLPAFMLVPVFTSSVIASASAAPVATADQSRIVGSTTPNTSPQDKSGDSEKTDLSARDRRLNKAVDIALRQLGDRYSYGAAGPNAFDCSGLLFYSFHKAGFRKMPRTSSAQAGWAKPISKRKMQRGDLMFFANSGGVYHAAIFIKWSHGHAVMLDAPYSGKSVQRTVPWTSSWFGRTLRSRKN